MPKPIEYCAAARPMSTGDSVDPMRPRLYEVATAVAQGDLLETVHLDVEGRPLQDEFLPKVQPPTNPPVTVEPSQEPPRTTGAAPSEGAAAAFAGMMPSRRLHASF